MPLALLEVDILVPVSLLIDTVALGRIAPLASVTVPVMSPVVVVWANTGTVAKAKTNNRQPRSASCTLPKTARHRSLCMGIQLSVTPGSSLILRGHLREVVAARIEDSVRLEAMRTCNERLLLHMFFERQE